MKKNRTTRKLTIILAATMLIFTLAACGKKPTMGSMPNEETGGFDVTAENIYETGNSGNVTITEGECLVVSPQLSKGHFVLTVIPGEQFDAVMEEPSDKLLADMQNGNYGADPVLEVVAEGSVMSAYSLNPGNYYVFVKSEKEKTTGTLSVMPYSIEELRAQNAALADTLKELPVEIEVPVTDVDGEQPNKDVPGEK